MDQAFPMLRKPNRYSTGVISNRLVRSYRFLVLAALAILPVGSGLAMALNFSPDIKNVMWAFRRPGYQMAQMLHGELSYNPDLIRQNLVLFKQGSEFLVNNPAISGAEGEDIKNRLRKLISDLNTIGPSMSAENFKMEYRKITENCNSCHNKYDNDDY